LFRPAVSTEHRLVTDRHGHRVIASIGSSYRHVSFMRICNCRIFRIFQQNAHIAYFPLQKLAFSTAILKLFIVFLLPTSIRFRYLDRLVANRMAPSMCTDPRGSRWGGWFQAILCHISAYFHRIFGVNIRSAYLLKRRIENTPVHSVARVEMKTTTSARGVTTV